MKNHTSCKSVPPIFAPYCALFIVDRITKYWALHYTVSRNTITPFLAFDLTFNRGVSWGILNTESIFIFYATTITVMIITLGILHYTYMRIRQGFNIYGELLIITGSLSNIIDRFLYTGVIDFIEVSYKTYAWPIFNCADMYIVLGVILMLIPLYCEP